MIPPGLREHAFLDRGDQGPMRLKDEDRAPPHQSLLKRDFFRATLGVTNLLRAPTLFIACNRPEVSANGDPFGSKKQT